MFTSYKKEEYLNDFTVQNALFGAVKITKDKNIGNYKYSGYGGIFFDSNRSFYFGHSVDAKNLVITGFDISFSAHANNRANSVYVLGKYFLHQ